MSTPSDQPPSPAPKSPLSGAPITPAHSPSPAPAAAHADPALTRPAFKVTRSPFAPKISGMVPTGPLTGPISISSAPAPSVAPQQRKVVSASGKITTDEPAALVLVDFIVAAIAVAAAVMLALAYFKK